MRGHPLFLVLLALLSIAGLFACSGAQQAAPGPELGSIAPGANPLGGGGQEAVDPEGPAVVPVGDGEEASAEEDPGPGDPGIVEITTEEGSIDKSAYAQEFYNQSFRARGGSGEFDWSISGDLGGLGLGEPTTALGTRMFQIGGTPTAIGVYAITITVKDKVNAALTDSLTYNLEVLESPNAMKTMSMMDLCQTPPSIEVVDGRSILQLGDAGQRIALRINGGKPPYVARIVEEAVADSWHCHDGSFFGTAQERDYFFPDILHHESPSDRCEWTQNTTWRLEPDPQNFSIFWLTGDLKYNGPFNIQKLHSAGGVDDLGEHPQDVLKVWVSDQCAQRADPPPSEGMVGRKAVGSSVRELKFSLQYPDERLDQVKVRMRYNQNSMADVSCDNDGISGNCLGTWVDLFSGPYLAIYLQGARTEDKIGMFTSRAYPQQCPEDPKYSAPMEIRTDIQTKGDAYFRLGRLEQECPVSIEDARCDDHADVGRQHGGKIQQVKELLLLWGWYDWCMIPGKSGDLADNYKFNLRGLQFNGRFWGASYDDDSGDGGDKFSSMGSLPGGKIWHYLTDREAFPGMSAPNSNGGVFHRLAFPSY